MVVLSRKAGKCLRSEIFWKTFTYQIRTKKKYLLGKEKNITPSVIKNISSTLFFKGSFFEIIQQLIQSLYSDMLINFAIEK